MQITVVARDADPVLLRCTGEINLAEGADNPLLTLLGSDCYSRKVLIDLEQAGFIDSSGISWLVTCQKNFAAAGGLLVLHSVPPMILQPLKLMHMERVLHLADNLAAAQAQALGNSP